MKCNDMMRTVSDGVQNGGDVDITVIFRTDLPPAVPVVKPLCLHVFLREAAQQHDHSVWGVKESVKCTLEVTFTEHVQEGHREEQHDALATVEVFKVISVELICRVDRVQQGRPLAEFARRFQDLLQIRRPFLSLGRVQDHHLVC